MLCQNLFIAKFSNFLNIKSANRSYFIFWPTRDSPDNFLNFMPFDTISDKILGWCLQLILSVLFPNFTTLPIFSLLHKFFIYSISHLSTMFCHHSFDHASPFPTTLTSSFCKYSTATHSLRSNKKYDLFYCHFPAQPKITFFSFALLHLLF